MRYSLKTAFIYLKKIITIVKAYLKESFKLFTAYLKENIKVLIFYFSLIGFSLIFSESLCSLLIKVGERHLSNFKSNSLKVETFKSVYIAYIEQHNKQSLEKWDY
jgi:hypothetical protein